MRVAVGKDEAARDVLHAHPLLQICGRRGVACAPVRTCQHTLLSTCQHMLACASVWPASALVSRHRRAAAMSPRCRIVHACVHTRVYACVRLRNRTHTCERVRTLTHASRQTQADR